MAVPKRRLSRSNTRKRRSQWKGRAPAIQACPCPRKEAVRPHHVCTHCGLYKGRQVLEGD
ncbi:50S ribosomal protein L32 [Glycomyces buryatensis]|uniref:Large ribosomal subunit protein bL32 n=1 Tax=Glycomyces buryatensis TaxID=2570927 RepID=A0A4S8QIJ1_9ACTN|nr:50S ribosomal protein L32 [Glycomyces buryatensis]THV42815.1 50S ribosomal protein L32 [Glycomyces buryatensis]